MSKKQEKKAASGKAEPAKKNEVITDDEFGGIFDLSEDQIFTDERGERNPDFYTPSLAHPNADGEYKSRIRLIPNIHEQDKKRMLKISKWIYYLPDPENPDRGFYVDCPSNLPGSSLAKSNILTTAFFELREHESAQMRKIGKVFGRKRYHWSLALVMIDSQEEEDEGKIKIFRFGSKINEMVEREAKKDEKLKKEPVYVHDPFRGKDLFLVIDEKQTDVGKITSYERSYFHDQITTISLDKGESRLPKNNDSKQLISTFLRENSPDMSQVYYKEWDELTEQKVIEAVQSVIADNVIFDRIFRKAYSGKKKFVKKEAQPEKETAQPEPEKETKVEETAQPEATQPEPTEPETKVEETAEPEETLQEKVQAQEQSTTEPEATEEEPISNDGKEESTDEEFDDLQEFDFNEND